jgi:hypothetical protein
MNRKPFGFFRSKRSIKLVVPTSKERKVMRWRWLWSGKIDGSEMDWKEKNDFLPTIQPEQWGVGETTVCFGNANGWDVREGQVYYPIFSLGNRLDFQNQPLGHAFVCWDVSKLGWFGNAHLSHVM